MEFMMDTSFEEKINRDFRLLSRVQQELAVGYGFRQIKYMIENDFSRAEQVVPEGAVIQGVNDFGRWQAVDIKNQKRYAYFPSNNEWSQAIKFDGGGSVDALVDIKRIYNQLNLKMLTLEELHNISTPLIEKVSKHQKNANTCEHLK